jgi:hypothetical protein
MTRIDKYIKLSKWNKIYNRANFILIILMIIVLIPFIITAFGLLGTEDQSYNFWNLTFWIIYWLQLFSSRKSSKTGKKIDELSINEEELLQAERQRKLDKLI